MGTNFTELNQIWESLADFSALQGYDGWMIGSAVLRRTVREADVGDGVRSRIAPENVRLRDLGSPQTDAGEKKDRITETRRGDFAIMKHSVDCGNRRYTLELHVVKPSRTDENPEVVRDMELSETHEKTGGTPTGKFPEPEKQPVGEPELIIGELLDEYRFSVAEILQFTEAVGDTNPIHRRVNPVVPGLLIFRRFLEYMESTVPYMSKGSDMPEQDPVAPITWRMRFFDPLFAGETVQVYRQDEKNGRICICGYEKGRGVCIWNVHIS